MRGENRQSDVEEVRERGGEGGSCERREMRGD